METTERISALPDLIEALQRMVKIRRKQWQECADIAFVKGQVLFPWEDVEQAEAALRKAGIPT